MAMLFSHKSESCPLLSPAVLRKKDSDSWSQYWLFTCMRFQESGDANLLFLPAVLKRKGLESWVRPWLFIVMLFSYE